jgi:hypothetical protein
VEEEIDRVALIVRMLIREGVTLILEVREELGRDLGGGEEIIGKEEGGMIEEDMVEIGEAIAEIGEDMAEIGAEEEEVIEAEQGEEGGQKIDKSSLWFVAWLLILVVFVKRVLY